MKFSRCLDTCKSGDWEWASRRSKSSVRVDARGSVTASRTAVMNRESRPRCGRHRRLDPCTGTALTGVLLG